MKRKYLSVAVATLAFAAFGAHAQTLTLPQQTPGTLPQTPSVIPEPPKGVTPPSVDPVLKPRVGAKADADARVNAKAGKSDAKAGTSAHGQAASNGPNRASAGSDTSASSGANRAGAGTEVEGAKR